PVLPDLRRPVGAEQALGVEFWVEVFADVRVFRDGLEAAVLAVGVAKARGVRGGPGFGRHVLKPPVEKDVGELVVEGALDPSFVVERHLADGDIDPSAVQRARPSEADALPGQFAYDVDGVQPPRDLPRWIAGHGPR